MKAVRKVNERGSPAVTNRFRLTRVGKVFASAEALQEWKGEKVALERDIAMKQERLSRVNMRLRAAGVIGDDSPKELPYEVSQPNEAKPLAPGNKT
jgi:hypothetical protein